jgi:heat shock protein HslJ
MKKIILGLLLCLGCRPSNQIGILVDAIKNRTLEETRWYLIEINDRKLVGEVTLLPNIIFHVKENSLSGFGGCNRLTGSYKKDKTKITSQVASTRMACEGKMETENEFTSLLGKTMHYHIHEGELTLTVENKIVARLKAEQDNTY